MRSTAFAALYALGVIACASPTVSEPPAPTVPTYYADVAPIIDRACGGCHREGGSGPFSLATFDEVAEQSGTITRVTVSNESALQWAHDGVETHRVHPV